MAKQRAQVFVSHIASEAEIARILQTHLLANFGKVMDVFVSSDGRSIELGRSWLAQLKKALGRAEIAIVLCSEESVRRSWVNFEAGASWIRDIPVIPVCHSGMTLRDLPPHLETFQAVDVTKAEGVKNLYRDLASRLRQSSPKVNFEAVAAEIRGVAGKPKTLSAEFLTSALDATVPVWICDGDTRIVYMNSELAQLLGVLREDFIGKRYVRDLVVAATKHMSAEDARAWMDRQTTLNDTFIQGDWSRGEDVMNLVFSAAHRLGGRSGSYRYRIVASRIERESKSTGAIAMFFEERINC